MIEADEEGWVYEEDENGTIVRRKSSAASVKSTRSTFGRDQHEESELQLTLRKKSLASTEQETCIHIESSEASEETVEARVKKSLKERGICICSTCYDYWYVKWTILIKWVRIKRTQQRIKKTIIIITR